MTQEDIIKLAREAGGFDITSHGWTSWVGTQSTEFLECFAKLVAAAEREACAKVCSDLAMHREVGSYGMLVAHSCANEISARGKA
jgi:hypothetical protein